MPPNPNGFVTLDELVNSQTYKVSPQSMRNRALTNWAREANRIGRAQAGAEWKPQVLIDAMRKKGVLKGKPPVIETETEPPSPPVTSAKFWSANLTQAQNAARADEEMLKLVLSPGATDHEDELRDIAKAQRGILEQNARAAGSGIPQGIVQSGYGMARTAAQAVPLAAGAAIVAPSMVEKAFQVGEFLSFSRRGAGELSRDLLADGYSLSTVRKVAIPFGAIYGAAEMMFDVAGKAFGLSKVPGLAKPTIRSLAFAYAKAIVQESAEEAPQTAAKMAFTNLASAYEAATGREFPRTKMRDIFMGSYRAFVDAAPVAAGLVGPGVAVEGIRQDTQYRAGERAKALLAEKMSAPEATERLAPKEEFKVPAYQKVSPPLPTVVTEDTAPAPTVPSAEQQEQELRQLVIDRTKDESETGGAGDQRLAGPFKSEAAADKRAAAIDAKEAQQVSEQEEEPAATPVESMTYDEVRAELERLSAGTADEWRSSPVVAALAPNDPIGRPDYTQLNKRLREYKEATEAMGKLRAGESVAVSDATLDEIDKRDPELSNRIRTVPNPNRVGVKSPGYVATLAPAPTPVVAEEPVVETAPDGDKTVSVPMPDRKANNLTPKEQQSHLLDEVDAAIDSVLAGVDERVRGELKIAIDAGKALPQYSGGVASESGDFTFKVPGDGEFKIPGTIEALAGFRKRIKERFVRGVTTRRTTGAKRTLSDAAMAAIELYGGDTLQGSRERTIDVLKRQIETAKTYPEGYEPASVKQWEQVLAELQRGAMVRAADGTVVPKDTLPSTTADVATPSPLADKVRAIADQAEAAARKRLKKRGGRAMATDPLGIGLTVRSAQDLADMAEIGAAFMARGIVNATEWAAAMVKEFGEHIRPMLDRIRKMAEEDYAQHKFTARVSQDENLDQRVRKAVEMRLHEVKHNRDTIKRVMGRLDKRGLSGSEVDFYDDDLASAPYERVVLGMAVMRARSELAKATTGLESATHYRAAIRHGEKLDQLGLRYGRAVQAFAVWNDLLLDPDGARRLLMHKMRQAYDTLYSRKQRTIDAIKAGLAAAGEGADVDAIKAGIAGQLKKAKIRAERADMKAINDLAKLAQKGNLTEETIADIIAKHHKLSALTTEDFKEIDRLGEAVRLAPEGFQRNDAITDLLTFVTDKIRPVKVTDLAWSLWYASILSGLQTHQRNVISTFWNSVSDMAALAATKATHLEGRQLLAMAEGAFVGAKYGVIEAASHWKTGRSVMRGRGKFEGGATGKALPPLERKHFAGLLYPYNAAKYVGRALTAADMLFFKPTELARMYQLAAELAQEDPNLTNAEMNKKMREILGLTKDQYEQHMAQIEKEGLGPLDRRRRLQELREQGLPEDLRDAAIDFAERATFNYQPEGMIGVAANHVSDYAAQFPFPSKFVVPFTGIVANVCNATIDHSPWGYIRAQVGSTPQSYHRVREMNTDEISMRRWKATFGSAAMLAGLVASLKYKDREKPPFLIHGRGPSDTAHRRQLYESGWRPYTIQFGDRYVDYRFTPVAVPYAIIGNLIDAEKYGEFDEMSILTLLAYSTVISARAITEMSFLAGASLLMSTINETRPEESVNSFLKYAARVGVSVGLTPAIIGNMFVQIDKAWDKRYSDVRRKDLGAYVMSEVPIARHALPAKVNRLGEPVNMNRAVFTWKQKDRPIWNWLNDNRLWLKDLGTTATINGDAFFADEKKWRQYEVLSGTYLKRQIKEQFQALRAMSHDDAQKRLNDLCDEANRLAKRDMGDVKSRLAPGPDLLSRRVGW